MKKWLALGYDPGTLKHRELFVGVIKRHLPFETLLDVGCATGPDIALINLLLPKVKCSGFDVTPEDIEIAKANNPNADLWAADLRTGLKQIPDNSYDVVISNGVMMYHDPMLVLELERIARKAVIMSERDPGKKLFEAAMLTPKHRAIITTRVSQDVRDSWKEDGFIYELWLN